MVHRNYFDVFIFYHFYHSSLVFYSWQAASCIYGQERGGLISKSVVLFIWCCIIDLHLVGQQLTVAHRFISIVADVATLCCNIEVPHTARWGFKATSEIISVSSAAVPGGNVCVTKTPVCVLTLFHPLPTFFILIWLTAQGGAGVITVWCWCVFYCVEPFGSQATRPSPPRSITWAHTSWMTTPWRCGLSERSSRTTTATRCFLRWALVPSFHQTDGSLTSLLWWGDDLFLAPCSPSNTHLSVYSTCTDLPIICPSINPFVGTLKESAWLISKKKTKKTRKTVCHCLSSANNLLKVS